MRTDTRFSTWYYHARSQVGLQIVRNQQEACMPGRGSRLRARNTYSLKYTLPGQDGGRRLGIGENQSRYRPRSTHLVLHTQTDV